MTQYVSELELVNERLKHIDDIMKKFSGFPEVQQKLQGAKDALVESEEEIMTYYDLTSLEKYNKS
jgi:hypothetical protein